MARKRGGGVTPNNTVASRPNNNIQNNSKAGVKQHDSAPMANKPTQRAQSNNATQAPQKTTHRGAGRKRGGGIATPSAKAQPNKTGTYSGSTHAQSANTPNRSTEPSKGNPEERKRNLLTEELNSNPSPYTNTLPAQEEEDYDSQDLSLDDSVQDVYSHMEEDNNDFEDDETEYQEKPKRTLTRRLLIGGTSAALLAGIGGVAWKFWAKDYVAPDTNDFPEKYSPAGALANFQDALHGNTLAEIFPNGYFDWENKYANASEYRKKLLETLLSKVQYTIPEIEEVTSNGRHTGKKIRDPLINPDSKVKLEVPALDQMTFNEQDIKSAYGTVSSNIISKKGDKSIVPAFKATDAFYTSIDVFCQLVVEKLNKDYAKDVHNDWKPEFDQVSNDDSPNGIAYSISPKEEQRLNDLLFGKMFVKAIMNFSAAHTKTPVPPEWSSYFNSDDGKEPLEIPPAYTSIYWAGSHRLLELLPEMYKESKTKFTPVFPPSGKGTEQEPYGLNTKFAAVEYIGEAKVPLIAEILDIKTGDDAIKYFVAADDRNKGMFHYSKREYVYLKLRVLNVSGDKAKIKDDFTLVEKGGTVRNNTGNVYGLRSEVDLDPSGIGIIEVWGGSDALNDDKFAWGKSNPKKEDFVYLTKSMPKVELESIEN